MRGGHAQRGRGQKRFDDARPASALGGEDERPESAVDEDDEDGSGGSGGSGQFFVPAFRLCLLDLTRSDHGRVRVQRARRRLRSMCRSRCG